MRSAEFNRETVLQSAMEAFRSKGYAKTTMQDLVAATGLHPGSLYAAFGNKRGLLLAAVDHYIESKRACRRARFAQGEPLAAIEGFLRQVVSDTLDGCCLITRTLVELAEQDEELRLRLKASYGELEEDLAVVLEQAREKGELAADVATPTLTAFLLVSIQGLVTVGQCRPEPELLGDVVSQVMASLRA